MDSHLIYVAIPDLRRLYITDQFFLSFLDPAIACCYSFGLLLLLSLKVFSLSFQSAPYRTRKDFHLKVVYLGLELHVMICYVQQNPA